jgi:hypothetical protein
MWVVDARAAVLSITTGSGKWVEIKVYADPPYQHLLLTAEKKIWRCVQSGERPRLFGTEAPRPRLGAVRVVENERVPAPSQGRMVRGFVASGWNTLNTAATLRRGSRSNRTKHPHGVEK